ncbi:MAG: hypothetical protein AAB425_05460 [Bdellovibrionota bacterium]
MIIQKDLKIQEFIAELTGFAAIAEDTLNQIEAHKDEKKDLFSVFSERMFAIRGTADQLGLEHISHIAHLGEEIAIKAVAATTRAHVRKCTGSLWDALTTVKHLLKHHGGETSEEQGILINRLESTLTALGGPRPTVTIDEIDSMLSRGGSKRKK